MARGDVIFYRPEGVDAKGDLQPEDFEQFAVLAAYAQTVPYPPDDFRPWHHVALSISDDDDTVLGFAQPDYQPDRQPHDLQEPPKLGVVDGQADGQARDALRPPAALTDALVDQMEAMLGAPYSAAGLLPFAAITAAWMLPDACVGREKLRAVAFGASDAARDAARAEARNQGPEAESCTTAVARAVRQARGGEELALEEPPPVPGEQLPARRELADDPRIQAILELVVRLDSSLKPYFDEQFVDKPPGGGRGPGARGVIRGPFSEFVGAVRDVGGPEARGATLADHLALLDPNTRVSAADVTHALNLMALRDAAYFRGPPGGEYYPGGDLPFGAYLARVSAGLEVFREDLDFEAAGLLRDDGPITSDDYLISPAMLWGALLDAGFREVDGA